MNRRPSISSNVGFPAVTNSFSPRLRSFRPEEVKILLLENINPIAVNILNQSGYKVETMSDALSENELKEKLLHVHAIGIRSKTKITKNVLESAPNLLAIGCFCIGTNQVDLKAAGKRGIAVFNSPFSNSRSVAELMIGYMISLSRKLGVRNIEMHHNIWNKASKNCHEIRNKILGIIGYGHIGTQLSVLAESMGMAVIFHDILPLMPLGNAKPVESLNDLLKQSDFVSVHVPETDETRLMIGKEQISIMKRGSYLLNASRGSIVDLEAVKESLVSGHLGGAAIDVFPSEPQKNGKFLHYFHDFCDMAEIWKANGKKNIKLNENHIRNINTLNLILTPHIGGSTEEAQIAIGSEVATSIANYLDEGSTMKSVNLPELQLRLTDWKGNGCRILNVHYNVPGVLKNFNSILEPYNVDKQIVDSKGDVAYLIADVSVLESEDDVINIFEKVRSMPSSIMTRILR